MKGFMVGIFLVFIFVSTLRISGAFLQPNQTCDKEIDLKGTPNTISERCDLTQNYVCHPRTSTCVEVGNKTHGEMCLDEDDYSCNFSLGLVCREDETSGHGMLRCDCRISPLLEASEWNSKHNTCCSSVSNEKKCYFLIRQEIRERIIAELYGQGSSGSKAFDNFYLWHILWWIQFTYKIL